MRRTGDREWRGRERGQRCAGYRRTAGHSPRSTKSNLRKETGQPVEEPLFRKHPRGADLWKEKGRCSLAERGVLVDARAELNEAAILVAELQFPEVAERLLLSEVLATGAGRCVVDAVRGVRGETKAVCRLHVRARNDRLDAARQVGAELAFFTEAAAHVAEIVDGKPIAADARLRVVAGVQVACILLRRVARKETRDFVTREVRANGEAIREPGGGLVIRCHGELRATCFHGILDADDGIVLTGESEEAVLAGKAVVATRDGRSEQRATEPAVNVVVIVRLHRFRLQHVEADVHLETRVGNQVHIGAEADA